MVFAMLGLANVIASDQPTAVPKPLQGVRKIVVLGDSITQFGGRPKGYLWLLKECLQAIYPDQGFTVVNEGISGNRSTDMIVRFQRDVLDQKPDMVLISVGVNDVWHGFYDHPKGDGPNGIPLNKYTALVDEMVQKAQAQGAKVSLMSATLIGEDINAPENKKATDYNNSLRAIASKRHALFIDLQTPFRSIIGAFRSKTGSTKDLLTTDGVHMNDQGNLVMAEAILNAWGVPPKRRLDAAKALDKLLNPVDHAVEVPPGIVLSDRCPASASSESDGYGAKQATIPFAAGGGEQWCAANGEYKPNPWWQVDLGAVKSLTGIQLFFAPDENDTWHYRVEASTDGTQFTTLVDQSTNEAPISKVVHIFSGGIQGRWVRVTFTGPTAQLNWASIRRALVYGTP